MSSILRVLGFIWASPLTIFAALYAALFGLMGWYKYVGLIGDAFVWRFNSERSPAWLQNLWRRWGGHACGNVVVLKDDVDTDKGKVILRHEQEHVNQCMRLGVFQPIVYGVSWLGVKIGCRHSHPYYDNIFEIDARRAAGQVIDVVGTVKKLQSLSSKKNSKESFD